MELQDKISGRNVTDEMQKRKYRNEERKMKPAKTQIVAIKSVRADK